MKTLSKVLLLIGLGCWAPARTEATPYLHVGFNQVSGGLFYPVAGSLADQQAGFIVPALEHDAKDGYLFLPGVSWNPLNLGYIGQTKNLKTFLAGKLAFGPSVQTGDTVKMGLRWACQALPQWEGPGKYEALKALLAPGQQGVYADLGVYEAVPLNGIFPVSRLRPETYLGAVLVKKFGAPPAQ